METNNKILEDPALDETIKAARATNDDVTRALRASAALIAQGWFPIGVRGRAEALAPVLQRMAEQLGVGPDVENITREQLIKEARDQYQNDDTEVDDDARLSPADEDGTWVQAWVYVRHEDILRLSETTKTRIQSGIEQHLQNGLTRLELLLAVLCLMFLFGIVAVFFASETTLGYQDINYPVRVIQPIPGPNDVWYYTTCETDLECEDEWEEQKRNRGEVHSIRAHADHFDATLSIDGRDYSLTEFESAEEIVAWADDNEYAMGRSN